jgi:hypothetical protein
MKINNDPLKGLLVQLIVQHDIPVVFDAAVSFSRGCRRGAELAPSGVAFCPCEGFKLQFDTPSQRNTVLKPLRLGNFQIQLNLSFGQFYSNQRWSPSWSLKIV